jgi:thiol-disulfide isomerase/thioredoxin
MWMHPKRSLLALSVALLTLGAGIAGYSRPKNEKPRVLLFLSTDCPVAAQYTPRLHALYQKYSEQGVTFEAIFPNDLETKPSIQAYMDDRQYKFGYQIDLGATEAKKLGVRTVPTVVVLDASGHKVYLGAIDDNPDTSLVKHSYLDAALASTLNGQAPATRTAVGPGCALMPSSMPPTQGLVNYAAHVKPILDKHCISCHQPGEVAPFSLLGYANAKKWAPNIATFTHNRQMPPWKAIHGYGDFKNDNYLSESEITTLDEWNNAGAPKGKLISDESDANVHVAKEWKLGEPDLVVSPTKPFIVAPDGPDIYRNFVFKNDSEETKYVNGMDVHPGNRAIVHHVVVFVDKSGYSEKLLSSNRDGQEGYVSSGAGPGFFPDTSFGGWVPGTVARKSPEGTAFLLKPHSYIVVQVHYHKNGKPEQDQTKVGFYFAREKPAHIMDVAWLVNPGIRIPAGDAHHTEHLTFTAPMDMTIYGVMPHMHLLGKEMRATVTYPDGRTEPLVYVKDWDFNWQLSYAYKEPLKLPKGSKVSVEAVYDNSAGNPKNPNSPPKAVHWGEETTDEMMIMVAAYTRG